MFFFSDLNDEPVVNTVNSTNLEYIKIIGLFGTQNVEMQFDKMVNIYIGENGLGKTTILNCIYYILEKKFDKLIDIDFDKIVVKFKNDQKDYEVNAEDISAFNSKRMPRNRFREEDIEYILSEILDTDRRMYPIDDESIDIAVPILSRMTGMPFSMARKYIVNYLNHNLYKNNKKKGQSDFKNVDNLISAIDKHIEQKILYFTTYRRIENDFSKILSKEDRYNESDLLIQFGMNDVEKSIKKILTAVKDSSRESFNKMTGVLLNQYVSGNNYQNNKLSNTEINIEMAKIILDRLGGELLDEDKTRIVNLLMSEEIYDAKYAHLQNLLIRLIENYNKDKKYDDKIKKFADTCNKYLNGKEFRYNQSELTLNIYLNDSKFNGNYRTSLQANLSKDKESIINLSQLSSGEKQIVSLFSKLYLESDKESILIIDEPELSISMKWQRMLLPDIIRSDNCKLLLTVTHSPFIFENEFDMDAKEMRQSIDPYTY